MSWYVLIEGTVVNHGPVEKERETYVHLINVIHPISWLFGLWWIREVRPDGSGARWLDLKQEVVNDAYGGEEWRHTESCIT